MGAIRLLPLVVVLAWGPACAQEQIEVFRLSTQQIRGAAGAAVYDVDAIEQITAALSAGLPPFKEQALAEARARFSALSDADRQTMGNSARALGLASRYRLTKLPAIVFDQRAVVYGVPDVDTARRIYRAWLAQGG